MGTARKGFLIFAAAILAFSAGSTGQNEKNASPASMEAERRSAPPNALIGQDSYKVDVRLILVDVIATKDGEFFPDLKKSDFRVFEDGHEVRINSCDLISMGRSDIKLVEGMDKKEPAPPVILRKKRMAVLFDALNSWGRDSKKAIQDVSDELVSLAWNGTEIMVLTMDKANGLKMIQPFTDEEALIRKAAGRASVDALSPFMGFKDYDGVLLFGRYFEEDDKYLLPLPPGPTSNGGMIQNERLIRGEANLRDYATYTVGFRGLEYSNKATNLLTRTIGGLLAAIHMLESLPGRKNLLYVSGGFPDIDSFKVDNEMALSRGLRIFDPFGILGKKTFWTGSDVLEEIIRVANDRSVSIYAIDPSTTSKVVYSGPTAEHFDRGSGDSQKLLSEEKYRQLQNLQTLSDKTGAKLLRGADKIDSLRQVVANDLSFYYQLSYVPPRNKTDEAYHKIDVKLRGRKDIRVQTREGYSDSFLEQSLRIKLAQAFYNPDLFRGGLPFEACFIPFISETGKVQPWMGLALPARFFNARPETGKRPYEFHFWIKGDDETGRILAGQVAVPFTLDESFKARLSTMDFLRVFFIGPGIEWGGSKNSVIFALFDPEMGDIGTWSSAFPPPFQPGAHEPCFINCVPGSAVSSPIDRKGPFLLSVTDGSLECGRIRFFPKTAGGYSRKENIHLFIQAYAPQGSPGDVQFEAADQSGQSREIKGTLAAESWNRNSKIRSAVYQLDFGNMAPGDYALKVVLSPGAAGLGPTREVRIRIL